MKLTSGWISFSGSGTKTFLPSPIADAAPDNWGRSVIQAAMGRVPSELKFLFECERSDFVLVRCALWDEKRPNQSGRIRRQFPRISLSHRSPSSKTNTLSHEICDVRLVRPPITRNRRIVWVGARPKNPRFYDDKILSIAKYSFH